MFEVVNGATRESDGYFRSYTEAVEFGLTGEPGESFEVWTVADDAPRTRMLLHGRHRIQPTDAEAWLGLVTAPADALDGVLGRP